MADSPRLEELRRRVQADPASIAFAALAEEYRRAGKFREAVDASRAGLRYHPTYVSARVTLGRSLVELQEVEQAERELVFVLKSAPDNLAARRALGELCWQQLRFGDALTHFRTAHTLAPADTELPQILQSLERELAADRNGANGKPEEAKAEDAKAEGAKAEEAKADAVKAGAAKAVEAKLAEAKPAEVKPVEVKAEEPKSAEVKAAAKEAPKLEAELAAKAEAPSTGADARVAAVTAAAAAAAPQPEAAVAATAEANANAANAAEEVAASAASSPATVATAGSAPVPEPAPETPAVDISASGDPASGDTLRLVRPVLVEWQHAEAPAAEPQPAAADVADVGEMPLAKTQPDAPHVEVQLAEVEHVEMQLAEIQLDEPQPAESLVVDTYTYAASESTEEAAAAFVEDAPVAEASIEASGQEDDSAEFAQFEPVAFVEHDELYDHRHADAAAAETDANARADAHADADTHADVDTRADAHADAECIEYVQHVQHVDAGEHAAAAGATATAGLNGQAHGVRAARVPNPALVRLERFQRAILASRARRRAQAASAEAADSANHQASRV